MGRMEALEKFDREQQHLGNSSSSSSTSKLDSSSSTPATTNTADTATVNTTTTTTTTTSKSIRPELVRTARQFLTSPRVNQTPWEEQRRFLLEKGLTEEEIREAAVGLNLSATSNNYAPGNSAAVGPSIMGMPSQIHNLGSNAAGGGGGGSFGGGILRWTNNAFVVGWATWVGYKVVREWVLPKFFGISDPAHERIDLLQTQMNELQNSTKFIMDSVVQTLETVSSQQEQLNRALMLMQNGAYSPALQGGGSGGGPNGALATSRDVERLHSDLSIVKSLLLNANQFPPPLPIAQQQQQQRGLPSSSGAAAVGSNMANMVNGTKLPGTIVRNRPPSSHQQHFQQRHHQRAIAPHQSNSSSSNGGCSNSEVIVEEEEEVEEAPSNGKVVRTQPVKGPSPFAASCPPSSSARPPIIPTITIDDCKTEGDEGGKLKEKVRLPRDTSVKNGKAMVENGGDEV